MSSPERKPAQKSTKKSGESTTAGKRSMWPTAFALKELTAAGEGRIAALVKKAVGS